MPSLFIYPVPQLMEPGSIAIGTRFHRRWNPVPPPVEPNP